MKTLNDQVKKLQACPFLSPLAILDIKAKMLDYAVEIAGRIRDNDPDVINFIGDERDALEKEVEDMQDQMTEKAAKTLEF